MISEKTKKTEKSSIMGFQKHFLKEMIDFFDNNTGKFIHYISDIEDIEPDVLKLDLNALNSLRRKKIIKKTGVKEGKKADVLKADLSLPCKLERKTRKMNKADMAVEAGKISDLCFYHRLDNPCIYVELMRGDVDMDRAMKYLLSLSPDLHKPVKNKQGKINITISKSDGIYYDERIKKYIKYCPARDKKSFNLIQLLLKNEKGEMGDFIMNVVGFNSLPRLRHTIDEINKKCRKIFLKENLIIKRESGGFKLNFEKYDIRKLE